MTCVDLPFGRIGMLQLPQTGGGAAEDVVMVHGLGASLGFWYASAVQWYRRFGRVTLIDLPGHGESDMPMTGYSPADLAATVEQLLDHLDIRRAHVVAHSFGGVVALALAARQPQRIKSLVLADVRLWAVEPPSSASASAPKLQRALDTGLTLTDTRDLSVQVLVELARQRLDREASSARQTVVFEGLPGARSLFQGERAARKWLRLMETTSAYDEMTDPGGLTLAEVSRIKHPMLGAYGGLSPRSRSALALQQSCTGCRIHVIPEVGHFFPLTRPRLFARPALAFLHTVVRSKAKVRRRRLNRLLRADLPAMPGIGGVEPALSRVMCDISFGLTGSTDLKETGTRGDETASMIPILS